jgi:hypothetical protein
MSYSNITSFLTSTPSWEIAKDAFASNMKLRIVEPPNTDYAIVRYVKDSSDFNNPIVREARSVVIHKPTNRLISVAPIKAQSYSEWAIEDTKIVQEFVDGTMINIFRTPDGEIQTASRSRIGSAKTKFSAKTFQEMINEALSVTPIKHYRDLLPEGWDCASVVIAHPENRIVCPVLLAKVTIVQLVRFEADGSVVVSHDAAEWPESHRPYAAQVYELGPISTRDTVDNFVNMKALTHKHAWQGVVLYNAAGERTKLRGIFYQTVKLLRGNDGTAEERYARLRATRAVKRYLEYFPEDEQPFFELEGALRRNTKKLYDLYVAVNISKTRLYNDCPWPYKYHVGTLHRRFVETLRSTKQKINLDYVINYVNSLKYEDSALIMKGEDVN